MFQDFLFDISYLTVFGGVMLLFLTIYMIIISCLEIKTNWTKLLNILIPMASALLIAIGTWSDDQKHMDIQEKYNNLILETSKTTAKVDTTTSESLEFTKKVDTTTTKNLDITHKVVTYQQAFLITQDGMHHKIQEIGSEQKEYKELLKSLNEVSYQNDSILSNRDSKYINKLFEQKYKSKPQFDSYFKVLFDGRIIGNYGGNIKLNNENSELTNAYNEMDKLYRNKDYIQLIKYCENIQYKHTYWYTPSFYIAISYLAISPNNINYVYKIFENILNASSYDPEYAVRIAEVCKFLNDNQTSEQILSRIDLDEYKKYKNQHESDNIWKEIFNALSKQKLSKQKSQ